MKVTLALALSSVVVLGGCTVNRTHQIASPSRQPVEVSGEVRSSTAEQMLSQDLTRVTPAEMSKCFRSEANRNGTGRIYTVVNDGRSGKKCSVIVARGGEGAVPARAMAEGMSISACQLKALSCARPALASRNVSRFGMEIDPVPFARK